MRSGSFPWQASGSATLNEHQTHTLSHGVKRRMISEDNFLVFLRLLFFAVLLLYVK